METWCREFDIEFNEWEYGVIAELRILAEADWEEYESLATVRALRKDFAHLDEGLFKIHLVNELRALVNKRFDELIDCI